MTTIKYGAGIDWRTGLPPWVEEVEEVSFVWIGSETCACNLPENNRLIDLMARLQEKSIPCSLIIPGFSESEKDKITSLVDSYTRCGGREIITNDINGAAVLHSLGLNFSMGRVTLEIDVDPRLRTDRKIELPVEYGKHGFNRGTIDWYKSVGCKRIYCQPVLPIPDLLLEDPEIEVGIIGPTVFIAQTYYCPVSISASKKNRNRLCTGQKMQHLLFTESSSDLL